MKITKIETFLADAGWRPWAFVKVQTDEGLVGYGEATCLLTQYAVLSAIEDLKPVLIGNDPLAFEARYWDMYRRTRLGSVGGVAGKAIGAIECALLDIKGKSLNVSVAELFGGPLREWVPLYFSHACVGRAIAPDIIGVKPVRSLLDVKEACIQIVEKGFNSLKTNIVYPGDPALVHQEGFGGGPGTTDQVVSTEMVRHTARFIGAIREAVGPDVGIILDLNFNFKPESVIRICRALEEYDLSWVELDLYDPDALRMIKDSIRMPVCSCETLFYMEQYRPYFEKHALDIVMLDAPWQGFAQAKKVGDLAQVYQMNVCPHNYYSHLFNAHQRAAVRRAAQRPRHGVRGRGRSLAQRHRHQAAGDRERPDEGAERARLGHGAEREGAQAALLGPRRPHGHRAERIRGDWRHPRLAEHRGVAWQRAR